MFGWMGITDEHFMWGFNVVVVVVMCKFSTKLTLTVIDGDFRNRLYSACVSKMVGTNKNMKLSFLH